MVKKRLNDSMEYCTLCNNRLLQLSTLVGMSNQRQRKTFESGEGAEQLNS